MNLEMPSPLLLTLILAAIISLGLLYLSTSTRTVDRRREERETRRISQQPWDAQSSDGRGNH